MPEFIPIDTKTGRVIPTSSDAGRPSKPIDFTDVVVTGLPGGTVGPTGPPGPPGVTGSAGPQGVQGPVGPIGPKGADGTSVQIKGSVANHAALPVSATVGDLYITLDTGHGWVWGLPGQWSDVGPIQGPPGATGATGAQGAQGPAGTAGPTGAQGPAGTQGPAGAQGAKGDPGSQGPTGPTGSQGIPGTTGTPGTPGEAWFSGLGPPAAATGAVNDWYIDSTNGLFYEKTTTSTWTQRGSLKGPTGATGSTGPGVPTGGTAGQGLYKNSSTNYDTAFKTLAFTQTATDLAAQITGVALKHCGFGATGKITPAVTGKVLVRIMGTFSATPASNSYYAFGQGRYGTGAAPALNAVATGTVFANLIQSPAQVTTGDVTSAEITQILQLTVGTTYWFDAALQGSNAAAVAALGNAQVQLIELP